jgi:hypothetical protein
MVTQAERFARCVKNVKKDFNPKTLLKTKRVKKSFRETQKEGASIAICTKSILWPQGRTLKRFYMKNGKSVLYTQKRPLTAGSKRPKK